MRYFQYQQTPRDFWQVIDSRLQERRETMKHMCESLEISYMTILHQRTPNPVYPKWDQACVMAVYLGIPFETLAFNREGRALLSASEKYAKVSDIADWLLGQTSDKLDAIRSVLGIERR